MNREHINRAHRALGIVSKIQDECDFFVDGGAVDYDELNLELYGKIFNAVRNPLREESVKILTPFCAHCKDWPSRDTWKYVEEFLTNYEVKKVSTSEQTKQGR